MGKTYYWIKLKVDFFTQKHIKKMRKNAGGDRYAIIYLELLLLACSRGGEIHFCGYEDSVAEELALEIEEPLEDIKATLYFLQKYGFVEMLKENVIYLPEVIKCTGKEGDSAERVRRHRDKKKIETLHCNALVTTSNTEIDKEIDKNLDLDKKEVTENARKNSFYI